MKIDLSMTMKRKIYGAFIAIQIVVMGYGVKNFMAYTGFETSIRSQQDNMIEMKYIRDLQLQYTNMELFLTSASLMQNQELVSKAQAALDQGLADIAKLKESNASDAIHLKNVNEIEVNLLAAAAKGKAMVEAFAQSTESGGIAMQDFFTVSGAVDAVFEKFLTGIEDAFLANDLAILERVHGNIVFLVVFQLVIFIGVWVGGTLVYYDMRKPLVQVMHALEGMAEGNFDTRLNVESNDEAGRMAAALNKTAESLNRKVADILGVVNSAAKGDLTCEVHELGSDPVGQIGSGLMIMVEKLRDNIGRLIQSVSTLGVASNGLSSVSGHLTKSAQDTLSQSGMAETSADEMSRNAHTVASAMEEMSVSIREIAKNSAEAAAIVGNAVKITNAAGETMMKLGNSSTEIGKVIKVITSIAEQTNLLALNATIEAARAGESGKGFAVVANEVKELAKETAKATEEIGSKINSIQDDTRSAVEAIGQIGKIVDQINNLQSSIASTVEEQTIATNEIARNISEVAKGSSNVAANMAHVTQSVQNTVKGADESKRVSDELQELAHVLKDLTEQYRFNKGGVDVLFSKDFQTEDHEIDIENQESKSVA